MNYDDRCNYYDGKLDDVLIEMNTYRKGAESGFCQE